MRKRGGAVEKKVSALDVQENYFRLCGLVQKLDPLVHN